MFLPDLTRCDATPAVIVLTRAIEYPLAFVLDLTFLKASSSFNIAAIRSSLNSNPFFSISSCKNSVNAKPPSNVLVKPAIAP